MVGGAPLNEEFAKKIGANFYGKDPQAGINYLNSQVA
jgi:methanogenic corrinoid protein MtbC1